MSKTAVIVIDAEGLAFKAQLEPATAEDKEQTLLQLDDGAQFLVPTELLVRRDDGRYDLQLRLREYAAQTELETRAESPSAPQQSTDAAHDTVIPVVEETLRVGKRTVEQGRVQLHKYVTERTETADVPLVQERVEVERVRIGRRVDEAASVRFEGDTMIVPLYEEVLVVTKQLMLVEEVRITTQRSERHEPQQVTLRREEVSVERLADEGDRTADGEQDSPDGYSQS